MLKHATLFIGIALIVSLPISVQAIKYKGDLEANESVILPEQSTKPANPVSGKHKLYFRDDGAAYSLDASGNENPIDTAGFKNYIINGNFDLWQRGTSFTSNNAYGADRWKHSYGSGAGVTSRLLFDLGQAVVPGGPRNYWQHNRTIAASSANTVIGQRIEGVGTLSGATASLSFYGQCDSAKTFDVLMVQFFGNGGSPSPQWVTGLAPFNCGIAWSQYHFTFTIPSISGKTLGTAGNDYVEILVQESGSFSTFVLDMAQVQLEKGSASTPFEYRPKGIELELAQRFYSKTYNLETQPGTATASGYVEGGSSGLNTGAHAIRVHWSFPSRMRVVPIVTAYSLNGTSGQWTDSSGSDQPVSVQRTGEMGTNIEVSLTFAGDLRVGGHITADAEL